jgi:hypothetical protein
MALRALVESLLRRLPCDGVLFLIPFNHRLGERGAQDILAQRSARILVIDTSCTVD